MSKSIVVCPVCKGALLETGAGGAQCERCSTVFAAEDGRPVLLVPGDVRFEDEADCCMYADEERTNAFTTASYHLPLLRRLVGPDLSKARILSAGCGVGADVDAFRHAGVEAYGVDCGSRIEAWGRRAAPQALQIGSVANLPYADASFDVVVTGCLLPHIGVVGDSSELRPDGEAQRARVAAELLRVTKPGGYIVTGNPNRLCPADLFHKGQMAGPSSLVRWHAPREQFLLSVADYVRLFGAKATVTTLPVANYWGFHTKESRPFTRLLARALKAYFAVLSWPPLDFLRRSALNPWLMVLVTKRPA